MLCTTPCLLLLQGITGIRFAEGEKCYIKAQPKAHVPKVDAMTKASLTSELVRGNFFFFFFNPNLYIKRGLKQYLNTNKNDIKKLLWAAVG